MKILVSVLLLSALFMGCGLSSSQSDEHEGHAHSTVCGAHDHSENHEGHVHPAVHDEHDHSEAESHDEHAHSHASETEEVHNHDESEATVGEHELHIIEVQQTDFSGIVKTSGKLINSDEGQLLLSAQHTGFISFAKPNIKPGVKVSRGEQLFTVAVNRLIDDNLERNFQVSKASFEAAESNYKRASELYKDTIITQGEFLKTKSEFLAAKAQWEMFSENYKDGLLQIVSPVDGFIEAVFVEEGEVVNSGERVVRILQSQRLVLQADLSQSDFGLLSEVVSANFVTPYDGKSYATDDLNGDLISYAKSTSSGYYTPLFFEVDNPGVLITGSFVEVYLKLKSKKQTIVVPKTALMEEQGSYYVYVKHVDEFDKHYVTLGVDDGSQIQILDGISVGDRVVTTNPYRVKMAESSSAIPHAHAH